MLFTQKLNALVPSAVVSPATHGDSTLPARLPPPNLRPGAPHPKPQTICTDPCLGRHCRAYSPDPKPRARRPNFVSTMPVARQVRNITTPGRPTHMETKRVQYESSPTGLGRQSLTNAFEHMEGVKHTCIYDARYTSRNHCTAIMRRFWKSEGDHMLSHTREEKNSQPHTTVPPGPHRNAQVSDNAETRSILHSPEPQLSELSVKCSRRRLLHGSSHDSGSAGGPKPWERGSRQTRVDESPGASGTAPLCAAPGHKPGWWTDYEPYPGRGFPVGPVQNPSRPGATRCGEALSLSTSSPLSLYDLVFS